MARQTLDTGVSGDPTSGEPLRSALEKVNTMTSEIYPALGATGPAGPQGDDAYAVAVSQGFSGTRAQWLASLVGKAGSTGPAGPSGASGPIGQTGPAGAQGAPGVDGYTGGSGNLMVEEDFATGTVGAGAIGVLGWTFLGGTAGSVDGELGRPGILRRSTSATASTIAATAMKGPFSVGSFVAAETFDMSFYARLLQTDVDTVARIGMAMDSAAPPPLDGVYIEKLGADTSWFSVTRIAGVETRSVLAATSTNWFKIRIRRIDAGTIGFTFDSAAETSQTTNIPTRALTPFWHILNLTAVNKTMDMDYFRLILTALNR